MYGDLEGGGVNIWRKPGFCLTFGGSDDLYELLELQVVYETNFEVDGIL